MPATELRPVQPAPVGHDLSRLRTFVSPLTGIVSKVDETLAAPDEHRLVTIGCAVADGRPTVGEPFVDHTGSEHPHRDEAEAAAIGEALERYSASFVPSNLVRAAAADLPLAIEPDRFALFHAAQLEQPAFPFRPFRRETVLSWVEGFALPGCKPAYLPAQLVFMRSPRDSDNEDQIAYTTSSGLACAATSEEAVLAGLLEQIERDAVMVTWYNRLSLPLLDWSKDPELVRLDRRYFAPTGLRYSAVDLSAFFGIPTVLGVVHGPADALGALGVGAASAEQVAVAWRKALGEAFGVQRWVRDRALEQPDAIGTSAEEIRTFEEHMMFYAHPDHAGRAAFLDSSTEWRDTRECASLEGDHVGERIEAVCGRLDRHRISAYAVDVTTSDVRAGGFTVARVLVPELCQLDVVQYARFLGGHRLYEAAFEAGLLPRPLTIAELNPDPHPFP